MASLPVTIWQDDDFAGLEAKDELAKSFDQLEKGFSREVVSLSTVQPTRLRRQWQKAHVVKGGYGDEFRMYLDLTGEFVFTAWKIGKNFYISQYEHSPEEKAQIERARAGEDDDDEGWLFGGEDGSSPMHSYSERNLPPHTFALLFEDVNGGTKGRFRIMSTQCEFCDRCLQTFTCRSGEPAGKYRQCLGYVEHEMASIRGAPGVQARNVVARLPSFRECGDNLLQMCPESVISSPHQSCVQFRDPWCPRTTMLRRRSDAATKAALQSYLDAEEHGMYSHGEEERDASAPPSTTSSDHEQKTPLETDSSGDESSSDAGSRGEPAVWRSDRRCASSSSLGARNSDLDDLSSSPRRKSSMSVELKMDLMDEVDPIRVKTRLPRWDAAMESLVLGFERNRVKASSSKNILMALGDDPKHTVLQFGKVSSGRFTLDFRYPMSHIQAFAIAVSSFGWSTRKRE